MFWFFLKYFLTDLSFKNASTKVFFCQDKQDSQKDVKSNNRKLSKPQNSHTKIGRVIFPRWSSLVILLHISFLILPSSVSRASWLTIEILIIYNSWFLFIHRFTKAMIALQFAWNFFLFVTVLEKFVSIFIIIIDIIIRQITKVTFVLGNFQLTDRLCSRETSTQEVWHN